MRTESYGEEAARIYEQAMDDLDASPDEDAVSFRMSRTAALISLALALERVADALQGMNRDAETRAAWQAAIANVQVAE